MVFQWGFSYFGRSMDLKARSSGYSNILVEIDG